MANEKLPDDLRERVELIARAFDESNIEGAYDGRRRAAGVRLLRRLARDLAAARAERDEALARLETAEITAKVHGDDADALARALRRLEWSSGYDDETDRVGGWCPVCNSYRPKHAEGCWLGVALAAHDAARERP